MMAFSNGPAYARGFGGVAGHGRDSEDNTTDHLSHPSSFHSGKSTLGPSPQPPAPPPAPPPPPPPPPSLASVFHNLFSYKKTSKSKRIHSVSLTHLEPSPPPPPPQLASSSQLSSDSPRQRKRNSAVGGRQPPLPKKMSSKVYEGEENLNSREQSPLIPMPLPPPPPPFPILEMNFVVHGGLLRIRSNQYSLTQQLSGQIAFFEYSLDESKPNFSILIPNIAINLK
ncbi:hypothetical protein NE237_031300 [Protea cynaroides]|uniref:Uncharacterized protein n=1 Tax=Protea cynaroides TaxID=273540 RepID=A0A9Q0L105_9MAGN|nr:hypothetical protein NE237_031300 [Protea cynaroides]